jgi:apocytochrome f
MIGLVPSKKYSEIVSPILLLNPLVNKKNHFLKYLIYVGGNRRKGKSYIDGSRSNDTVYSASTTCKVSKFLKKGGYEITIDNASNGRQVIDIVPPRFGRHGTETRN